MKKTKFKNNVIVKWRADGRTMKLMDDLSFIDTNGTTWLAAAGSIVDGASIPRILWPLVGVHYY